MTSSLQPFFTSANLSVFPLSFHRYSLSTGAGAHGALLVVQEDATACSEIRSGLLSAFERLSCSHLCSDWNPE